MRGKNSLQATKYLEIMLGHLEEAAKPSGNGKTKKKADPLLVDIVGKVRGVKNDLREKSKALAEGLGKLLEADQAIDWATVGSGFFNVSREGASWMWLTIRTRNSRLKLERKLSRLGVRLSCVRKRSWAGRSRKGQGASRHFVYVHDYTYN